MQDQVAELAERGKELAPEDRSRLVDMLLASLHGSCQASCRIFMVESGCF